MADNEEIADVDELGLEKPCGGNSVKLPNFTIVIFVIFIVSRIFISENANCPN